MRPYATQRVRTYCKIWSMIKLQIIDVIRHEFDDLLDQFYVKAMSGLNLSNRPCIYMCTNCRHIKTENVLD